MPDFSISNSKQYLYADFRSRSGRNNKTVETVLRSGCSIDTSENVSIVERFSCEEVPNFLRKLKRLNGETNG